MWRPCKASAFARMTDCSKPAGSSLTRRIFSKKTKLCFFVLSACALVLAPPACVSNDSIFAIDSLLNQAYSENRTLMLRISEGKAAPLNDNAGPAPSRFSRPSLIQAEAILARNFQKHTDSSPWWELQGRIQLLENDLYSARQSFLRAHELDPHSVPSLLGLGVTYFQIAENGARQKYGDALETLGEALELDPANQVAIFDRAIVEERIYCFGQAAKDWKKYFQTPNEPGWKQEAANHMDRVERHSFLHSELLSSQQVAYGRKKEIVPALENRIEEYIDLALVEWLPQASSDSRVALRALHRLAAELESGHGDLWLSDFLKRAPRRNAKAIQLLAQSSRANIHGDFSDAARLAAEARRNFAVEHVTAGEIRSILEEIWARRQDVDNQSCLNLVGAMRRMVHGHRYYLLQSQLYLEESACLLRNKDPHRAAHALNQAAKANEAGRFAAQALNIKNYRASMDRIPGNQHDAWLKSLNALQEFWQGTLPNKRAYSLYTTLAESAAEQQQWYAFFFLQQEAVRCIDATEQIYYQAFAHARLAEAARRAGRSMVASEEISRSEILFGKMPAASPQPAYKIDLEINREKLDAASGRSSDALVRLEALRSSAEAAQSYLIRFNFYMTVASIREEKQEVSGAEGDYRKAVELAAMVASPISDNRAKLRWFHGMEEAYRGLTRCLIAEGKKLEAFSVWEEYRSSQASSAVAQDRKDWIASLSKRIPADQILVSYFLAKKELVIWTLTAKGITADSVYVNETDFTQMASKLYLLCSDRNSSLHELRKYSSQLYGRMIKPIEGIMASKDRVVFEVDDQLGNVPFEVLVDDDGKYLIKKLLISYSPAIACHFGPQPGRFEAMRAKFLIVANPTLPASEGLALAPLTEAETEGQKIADLFPHSTLLKNEQATPRRVESLLPQATVFHFAAHSIFESGQLKLLLTPDENSANPIWDLGLVPADKLRSCRLAVLSACSTQGRGGAELHDPGNPVASLLAAGVTQVVASRWMVDSLFTADFMEQFYLQLKHGNEPDSALRAAALSISTTNNHPYYWAAFSLFGGSSTFAKEITYEH
jgi:CHAT domain-containing protein